MKRYVTLRLTMAEAKALATATGLALDGDEQDLANVFRDKRESACALQAVQKLHHLIYGGKD